MIRKTIFWTHLALGVSAGIVILMMSLTGVLLTYERQMLAWAESEYQVSPPAADAERLDSEVLLQSLREQDPAFQVSSITWSAGERTAVLFGAGRSGSRNLNPFTGEILPEAASGMREFFSTITAWHRWFDVDGEGRDTARAITGASNLAFLCLVLSGIYLWLPPVYHWLVFRTRLFFNPRARSAKARDYNWHHVFGIWIAIPLAIVVASALVFSYGWANALVYRMAGEEPPVRGGPTPNSATEIEAPAIADDARLSYDELFAIAAGHVDGWKKLTLQIPEQPRSASTLRFSIDRGNGGQPHLRQELVLDTTNGAIVEDVPFDSVSPGRKARSIIRFLHTGEVLGIAGQTLAGLVSLFSILMVWTGLALAYRRLIQPLFRKAA
jgi:uncharacterized iron-regulated membrane protein